MKLRSYYLIAILSVGLIPLLLTAWLALRASHETLAHEAAENLRLINRLIGDDLNQYVATVAERLRGRSTYPDFADFVEHPAPEFRERVQVLLDRVHNIDPVNISSVAILDRNGVKLLDTDASQAVVDERRSPWTQQTLRTGNGAVIPFTRPGERPFLWVTAPVRNDQGAFVGMLRIRLQLAVLQQIVQRATSGLATYSVVVDEQGVILAHGTRPDLIGTLSQFPWPEKLSEEPMTFPATLHLDESEEPLHFAAMTLREVPWRAAVLQAKSAHNSGARQLTKVTWTVAVVAVVLSVLAGLIAAHWLSQPILAMVAIAHRVGEGDFSARVREKGPDEIRNLAIAINEMTGRLHHTLEELERRVIETEMSERRTREVVAANPIAVALADEKGEISQLNQAFLALFGYTLAEIQNLSDFWTLALPDPMQRQQVVRSFEQRLRQSRSSDDHVESFEAEFVNRQQERKIVELRARAIGPMVIVACLDLTARREAELEVLRLNAELEQRVASRTLALSNANAELESFSYAVSHDLRSPLRAIDGFSRALEEDYGPRFDQEAKDYLVRIRAATRRMGVLIDDLLKLAKVTRAELKKEPLDLSERARELFDEIRSHESKREINFICAPHVTTDGDKNLLRIAMENLLHNACKYTRKQPHAVVEFGVKEFVSDEGRAEKVYFVKDNGAGFDMRYAGKLFGAFQRLHNPADFEGTGVGLATVRRVVNRHGGRIWAEAEVNRGATFYFTLGEVSQIKVSGTASPFPTHHGPR